MHIEGRKVYVLGPGNYVPRFLTKKAAAQHPPRRAVQIETVPDDPSILHCSIDRNPDPDTSQGELERTGTHMKDKVITWTTVAFYTALVVAYVIWRIFGDHHAHNGAMHYLRVHTG